MTDQCIDAFKNLYIHLLEDSVAISMCCINLPVTKVDSIDFYNDKNLISMRNIWKDNKFPASCSICKKSEVAGNPSRRLGSNSWYNDNNYNNDNIELIRLDFWCGDTCNLRCVICNPDYSSAWKEELKIPLIERKIHVNTHWRSLDLTKLRFIHFNGGEPLLSKEHVKFLETIPVKSQVHINYNTNGTIRPSAHLLELWKEFKLVQIDFSIDDIEQRFEYQRYPAKWNKVTDNLQWYIDHAPVNCMFAVNTTVSILNRHNLTNLNAWLSANFASNRVSDPIERRQQEVSGIFSKFTLSELKEFLDACDLRRGTNWKMVFPELIDLLN